jgi:hypothetical protein
MPLIDVIYPSDALSPVAQKELSETLWSKALRWKGIDDNESAASVAWVYLDGRPRRCDPARMALRARRPPRQKSDGARFLRGESYVS